MTDESIQVSIMGLNEVVWQGTATALTGTNAEGVYDILPGHANFMTLIKGTDVTLVLDEARERTFSFDLAVLFFQDDVAKIYVHTSKVIEEEKDAKV